MSKPITMVIFPDPEQWLRDNLPDLGSDSVASVVPAEAYHLDGTTTYTDTEDGSTKDCTLADHVQALRLLCEQINQTLFVGGIKSPLDLTDAGNWDAEVTDAYWQLVYYGEVIYG